MKSRPIIFSGDMISAILEGRKTQTRRAIEPQPDTHDRWDCGKHYSFWKWKTIEKDAAFFFDTLLDYCPYGQVGDQLWLKETWHIGAWDENYGRLTIDYRADNYARREWLTIPNDDSGEKFLKYWQQSTEDCVKAGRGFDEDGQYHWEAGQSPCRWRSPIFMPRWASRITLEITKIRVERVQDIRLDGINAEGIGPSGSTSDYGVYDQEQFEKLWDKLNAKRGYGWEKNPWVWVIEFKVVKP